MCALTVPTLTVSSSAILWLDAPPARSRRTSTSRAVSGSTPARHQRGLPIARVEARGGGRLAGSGRQALLSGRCDGRQQSGDVLGSDSRARPPGGAACPSARRDPRTCGRSPPARPGPAPVPGQLSAGVSLPLSCRASAWSARISITTPKRPGGLGGTQETRQKLDRLGHLAPRQAQPDQAQALPLVGQAEVDHFPHPMLPRPALRILQPVQSHQEVGPFGQQQSAHHGQALLLDRLDRPLDHGQPGQYVRLRPVQLRERPVGRGQDLHVPALLPQLQRLPQVAPGAVEIVQLAPQLAQVGVQHPQRRDRPRREPRIARATTFSARWQTRSASRRRPRSIWVRAR